MGGFVARARELVADFDNFERRLNDYLAETAKEWASEEPELAADIGTLRLASIKLRSRQSVLVGFDGPDENVYGRANTRTGSSADSTLTHRESPTMPGLAICLSKQDKQSAAPTRLKNRSVGQQIPIAPSRAVSGIQII